MTMDVFLLGFLVAMALYHFTLYFLRKKDAALWYFGTICFVFCFREISTGQNLIQVIVPGISYNVHMRIVYLSFYLLYLFFDSHFSRSRSVYRNYRVILFIYIFLFCDWILRINARVDPKKARSNSHISRNVRNLSFIQSGYFLHKKNHTYVYTCPIWIDCSYFFRSVSFS
ncbi:7TM diverse intracellular signaling domain protein [Leptospira interrogans serovar Valbuzzi str. Duyster]|nr:7TM diverse intracellular signaling domain protein [Leptospira interrogans serovar Valbuzzi str. Duyster]ENO73248.1 7TM diverse intracellular signaling domain protein [Leptospira interrogans serovar Valbuzzi str. Valbuzzi]